MVESTTVPQTDYKPRCWRCNRVLAARLSRPWEMRCKRCKAVNVREGSTPQTCDVIVL